LPGKLGFEGKAKLRLQTGKTQRKTSPALGLRCLSLKKGQALPVLFCFFDPSKSRFLLFDASQ
jgi:hypothetical protein